MTAPIVRFAPSPTGKLHVGNVRTALINWLFARKLGGTFILRIDDTDRERSTAAFEEGIKRDLSWLGLNWDDTFNQSERFDEYDAARDRLIDLGLLYPCYETADELERARKIALSRGRPPVYNRAGLALDADQRRALEAEGRKPHWRFKLSGERCEWTDLVRGPQSIDTSSISDPVLIRADGSYLYTLPSVVDDIEFGITHVVRGEDHVTNSGAQLEVFKALGGTAVAMAHTPLLVGADGQGLSKRLGSLSIEQLRQQEGIEPAALCSLLAKMGTSDPIDIRHSLEALAEEFDFGKIGRAPARFDERELANLNANLLSELEFGVVADRLESYAAKLEITCSESDLPAFWEVVRGNLATVREAADWLPIAFGSIEPDIAEEDRGFIGEALQAFPEGQVDEDTWKRFTEVLKAETGRKGRTLFMPLRKALTGRTSGPEMDKLLVLMGRDRALERLGL